MGRAETVGGISYYTGALKKVLKRGLRAEEIDDTKRPEA